MAGETILSFSYGIEIQPKDDPYIKTSTDGVHPLMAAGVPGAFLVDAFPILKYVPAWFPGASFQVKAREWRMLSRRMLDMPYAAAKEAIVGSILVRAFDRSSHSRIISFPGGGKIHYIFCRRKPSED